MFHKACAYVFVRVFIGHQASSYESHLPWAAVAGVELLQTEQTADAALLTAGQRLHELHQHLQEGTCGVCVFYQEYYYY